MTERKTTLGEGLICGREYKIQEPFIHPSAKTAIKKRSKSRFLVDGINHPKGQPIRFKSREGAERHIRNIGQDKEFQSDSAV
jgi:hypothetical protein